MAFIEKTNHFEDTFPSETFKVVNSSEGYSVQNVEATDACGLVQANTIFGDVYTPSNSYVCGLRTDGIDMDIKLGKYSSAIDGKMVILTNVTINTAAGQAPTIDASGETAEPTSAFAPENEFYMLQVAPFKMDGTHCAQTLMNAFSISDQSGCYLQSANYTFACDLTKATKDGECVSHSVSNGRIEIALTIVQTYLDKPDVSVDEENGWKITSPLTCENADASYPTWTCTLTKYLTTKVVPEFS